MKKFFRWLVYILLTIIVLVTLAVVYVNKVFLPVKAKEILTKKAQDFLQRPVSIGALHFSLVQGLRINHIVIYSREKKDQPFMMLEELSVSFLLAPILTHKAIVVSSVTLKHPYIFVERLTENEWNFSDLLQKKSVPSPTSKAKKSSYTFLARKILIENGEVDFVDSSGNGFKESLRQIDMTVTISLNKTARFTIQTEWPLRNAALRAEGVVAIPSKNVSGTIKLKNIPVAEYTSRYYKNEKFNILQGVLSEGDFQIAFQNQKLQLSGLLTLLNSQLQFINNRTLSGDIRLTDIALVIELPSIKQNSKSPNSVDGAHGRFGAENEKLNKEGQKLQVKAKANLTSAQFQIDEERKIEGNISADIRHLIFADQKLSINGDVTAQKIIFRLGSSQTYQGDVTLTEAAFWSKNDEFDLQSQATISNLVAGWGNARDLKGNLSADSAHLHSKNRVLTLTGNAHLANADLKLGSDQSVKADMAADQLVYTLENGKSTVSGKIKLNQADIVLGDKKINGAFSSDSMTASYDAPQQIFETNGQVTAENIDLLIQNTFRFQGHPTGNVHFRYTASPTPSISYKGDIRFEDGTLDGLPKVGRVENLRGQVAFEPNKVTTDNLSFQTLNTSLQLSGTLSDFTHPAVNIKVKTDQLDLKTAAPFFSELLEKAQIDVTGQTSLTLSYNGELAKPTEADIQAKAHLKEADVVLKKLAQDIHRISGDITYEKDNVTWKDLTGVFQNQTYTLTGKLNDFSHPTVETSVSTEKIDLTTTVKILHKAFQILALKGTFGRSSFSVLGDVHLNEQSEPDLDLRIQFALQSRDLFEAFPLVKEKLIQYKIHGSLTGETLFRGRPKDWRHWQIALKAQSPDISVFDLPLEHATLQISQRDQNINDMSFSSSIYGGKFDIAATADLTQEDAPLQASINLVDMNLVELREKKQLKNKKLSGKVSCSTELHGSLMNPNLLRGTGSFTLTEGFLGQLIPEFKNAYFTDAKADFVIRDQKIQTENAEVFSQIMTLRAQGWIDFSRKMEFDVVPKMKEIALTQDESLKFDPTNLLSSAVTIKVSGTLDKPVYSINTSPTKIIDNTTDIIREGIGAILEGLF